MSGRPRGLYEFTSVPARAPASCFGGWFKFFCTLLAPFSLVMTDGKDSGIAGIQCRHYQSMWRVVSNDGQGRDLENRKGTLRGMLWNRKKCSVLSSNLPCTADMCEQRNQSPCFLAPCLHCQGDHDEAPVTERKAKQQNFSTAIQLGPLCRQLNQPVLLGLSDQTFWD